MKSILVTGGAGFIGSHTCLNLLENDYSLVVIDSYVNSSPQAIKKVKELYLQNNKILEDKILFINGDIRDEIFLEDVFSKCFKLGKPIFGVIHFAGLKSVNDSVNDPIKYWDVNVGGTINLLKVMKKMIVKQLFLVVVQLFMEKLHQNQ